MGASSCGRPVKPPWILQERAAPAWASRVRIKRCTKPKGRLQGRPLLIPAANPVARMAPGIRLNGVGEGERDSPAFRGLTMTAVAHRLGVRLAGAAQGSS